MDAALTQLPAGRWAVGVSGGADSVALLGLLRERMTAAGDLHLHVVHLDHQTRGNASTADAAFVADLAAKWQLPFTIATRDRVEANLPTTNANPSARYREARLGLFRAVVERENLQGVILAHHETDQAVTVFQRLLRGGGFIGVHGMAADAVVAGVRLVRPLLSVTSADLRQWLTDRGLPWREDASNQSPKYQRNRVRRLLSDHPDIASDALAMGSACAELREWTEAHAPRLHDPFATAELFELPELLAAHAARRWLVSRGAAAEDVGPATIHRLLMMARDPASPPRRHFPGPLLVRRRRGVMWAEALSRRPSLFAGAGETSPGTPPENAPG